MWRPFCSSLPILLCVVLPLYCQPAPKRSEDLCNILQQSAGDKGLAFRTTKPGACLLTIDEGYDFFVDYTDQFLHLSLSVDAMLLNGDAGAFWLRLSAFDNLAHTALGTPQQIVFDELNKLAKKIAMQVVETKQATPGLLHGKAGKATLGGRMREDGVLFLMASARVRDIDEMRRKAVRQTASGGVSGWRRILGLSLQAFAAGAQGYANSHQASLARQPLYRSSRTCYTSYLGDIAFTDCR